MRLNNNELMDIFLVRNVQASLDDLKDKGIISPIPNEFGDYEVNREQLDVFIDGLKNNDSIEELEQ